MDVFCHSPKHEHYTWLFIQQPPLIPTPASRQAAFVRSFVVPATYIVFLPSFNVRSLRFAMLRHALQLERTPAIMFRLIRQAASQPASQPASQR